MKTTSVILAAGHGTRMVSDVPKMVHPILGRPMIWHAVNAAREATGEKPLVVVGYGADAVREALGDGVHYTLQSEQLGTGHAVQQAETQLRGKTDAVLVSYGDMPLVSSGTLSRLVAAQSQHSGPITMLTVVVEDPRGFGRIVRDGNGQVTAIVEEVDATPEQLKIRELNPGLYCFQAEWLWEALKKLQRSPSGEFFLTDVVGLAVEAGLVVQAIRVGDVSEMIGVNTRVHLADAVTVMRRRINERWMLSGVTLVDPQTTYIEPGVTIGQDSVIWPNTYLQGKTVVGTGCTIGPNSVVRDTTMGNNCQVFSSVLEGAVLEDDVDVGPFGHLRTGAHLAQGVHMGNFGEVKNSYLGPGTKMGHFSYLGDTTTGANVNIGAGTITCNYDGEKKHATHIGDDVFIGSDTMLVAPLSLGEGARTGAGSVVTKDVPDHTQVVGIPARAIRNLKEK